MLLCNKRLHRTECLSEDRSISLRVVSEARRAMRLHEHGVFARFRYNDLKEAARDCGGRGPYANSMVGRSGVEPCRGCAAGPATWQAEPGSRRLAKDDVEKTGGRIGTGEPVRG